MKKLLISFTIAGLLAGCSNDPVSSNNTDVKFGINKLNVDRNIVVSTDPRISATGSSISKFAVSMYKQIIEDDKNIFFSPYSITTAFGMADAGAKGNTDLQIRQALQVALDGDDFHGGLNGLDLSLKSFSDATDNLELNVENSIWAQDNVTYFKIGYLDKLARNYGAGIYMLDFMREPDSSRIIINDWVARKTNQRIKDLIPPPAITPDTRLVLTNAIYFLADWKYKFDSTLTSTGTFYTTDGNSIQTPMMRFTDEPATMLYNYSGGVRMLELPYKGDRIVMDLILPDSGKYKAFEDSVTDEGLSGIISGLDSTKLKTIKIPKFQFTTPSVSLTKALQKLGMIDPFTSVADFSGIADIPLTISDVLHKAFIKVDESGTEAAAATAIIVEITAIYNDPNFFVANRPFMYLIRDKETNAILFMGRIMNPAVSE
ncbi:MAG: serpin family protein [Fibrobacter sp.]|nr:serpin family protein [Fibrobacter sp.]